MTTVALVDDQALVRTGFRMILSVEDDLQLVGEASDGLARRPGSWPSSSPTSS